MHKHTKAVSPLGDDHPPPFLYARRQDLDPSESTGRRKEDYHPSPANAAAKAAITTK